MIEAIDQSEILHELSNLESIQTSRFRAYRSTIQSIPNAVSTKVQFQTENYDNLGEYDNATNYRFQPGIAGYYQIDVGIQWADSLASVTVWNIYLVKNGVLDIAQYTNSVHATYCPSVTISTQYYLSATDYIEVFVLHNYGSARNIQGNQETFFTMHRFQ